MNEPATPSETERERRMANIVLLIFFILVIGIGVWLVGALLEARRIDNCLAQGRRDCARSIELPSQ